MRSARFVWVLCLSLAVPAWGQQAPQSQTPPPPDNKDLLWFPHPAQDPQAVQAVLRAINALGGTEAIQQSQNYIVQAQVSPSSRSQAEAGQAIWTLAGGQIRVDLPSPKGTNTLSSGNGQPFWIIHGNPAQAISPHVVRPAFAPALVASLLLSELQGTNYSIQFIGSQSLGSELVTVVDISCQASRMESLVTPQRWYFDIASNLPVRIDYHSPDVKWISRFMHAELFLSDYQAISGVLYPFQIVRWFNGQQSDTLTITSIQTNPNIPASSFSAPGGVQ
jgi:hypothetical protein